MRARKIKPGRASGKAVVSSCPMSFLGGIDTVTGKILDGECESKGLSISGKVFCFPFGKGSTVGSYAMYQLKLNGAAPAAIVNGSAEPIIATGAIIADIPMVDGIDVALLRTGDDLVLDADKGTLELANVVEKQVVTSIVRYGEKILLLQRSSRVGSYRGQWAGVSGFIESGEDDESAARRELEEEIGASKVKLVRRIDPIRFRDSDVIWSVHSFLFDVDDPEVRLDWEHQRIEWIFPRDVASYPTVPGLQQIVFKLLGC
jgi:hypothetical protein